MQHVAEDGTQTVQVELWGPVDTATDSVSYCGADKGMNNTGELIRIGQALLWLRDVASHATLSAPNIVDAKDR